MVEDPEALGLKCRLLGCIDQCVGIEVCFFILSRKNEANSSASCASIFPFGMGLGVLLMVMLLTRWNSCLCHSCSY